jgi:hypothetical protein
MSTDQSCETALRSCVKTLPMAFPLLTFKVSLRGHRSVPVVAGGVALAVAHPRSGIAQYVGQCQRDALLPDLS